MKSTVKRNRYLMFVSHAYALSILRPLEDEINRRGGEVAWFLEDSCPAEMLGEQHKRLSSIVDAVSWNPDVVFAPGNYIPDFLPGVKVEVFHGFPVRKRGETGMDDHFKLRGWFDIYCTQGPSSTATFRELENRCGYFKVYETGWPKLDPLYHHRQAAEKSADIPGSLTVLYATTFTPGISSAPFMAAEIRRMALERPWKWKIMLHPKITDPTIVDSYRRLAEELPNVDFLGYRNDPELFADTDVMLSDSSSIIVEYQTTGKPVVTYRNTNPDSSLINVEDLSAIPQAIEMAASRPPALMKAIADVSRYHHPYTDGMSSVRVLDAVDDFIGNHAGRLHRKPLNLLRRIKMRLKFRYFKL